MSRFIHCGLGIVFALLSIAVLTGCANEHFFPQTHGLFPGFNEAHLSPQARLDLAEAKADFLRTRRDLRPQYAHFAGQNSEGDWFQGHGYALTMVNHYMMAYVDVGSDIVLSPSITGGQPFHYREVRRLSDSGR